MSALPLVSGIMAAYNYERYVAEALDSALAQDYPEDRLELIVVDDGSTDGTSEIARSYAERVGRTASATSARTTPGSIAATVRGLQEARGDLITLLDADDVWLDVPHAPAGRRARAQSRRRSRLRRHGGDRRRRAARLPVVAERSGPDPVPGPHRRGAAAVELRDRPLVDGASAAPRALLSDARGVRRPGLVHRGAGGRGRRDRLCSGSGGTLSQARGEHDQRPARSGRDRQDLEAGVRDPAMAAREPALAGAHRRGPRRRPLLLHADLPVRGPGRERRPRAAA